MAKKTQLERVHEAIQNGYVGSKEISIATGLERKRVSDLHWHLKECDYDLDAARAHKSALSMLSSNRTKGVVSFVKARKARMSARAPAALEIGGGTIPVMVHVPTDRYGKDWIDPEVDAAEATVVDLLIKRTKHRDDHIAYVRALEEKVGRDFIVGCLTG